MNISTARRHALGVFIKDPKIRAWLKENDPKALEQAETVFGEDQKELDSCWDCDKFNICKHGAAAEKFVLDELSRIIIGHPQESSKEFMHLVAEYCTYYKRLEE